MPLHPIAPGPPTNTQPVGATFFFRQPQQVAKDLLGCLLVVDTDEGQSGGIIVETEAYLGTDDPGSHAATRGITERNSAMYGPAGTVYVYFTYGCHHMLNLVCCEEGVAGAVLVRAVEPSLNVTLMRTRRPGRRDPELCNGPGKLTAALGVDLSDNRSALGEGRINVYHGQRGAPKEVAVSGRVGLSEGHDLELRYYLVGNTHVSRGRTGPAGTRARGTHGRRRS